MMVASQNFNALKLILMSL